MGLQPLPAIIMRSQAFGRRSASALRWITCQKIGFSRRCKTHTRPGQSAIPNHLRRLFIPNAARACPELAEGNLLFAEANTTAGTTWKSGPSGPRSCSNRIGLQPLPAIIMRSQAVWAAQRFSAAINHPMGAPGSA